MTEEYKHKIYALNEQCLGCIASRQPQSSGGPGSAIAGGASKGLGKLWNGGKKGAKGLAKGVHGIFRDEDLQPFILAGLLVGGFVGGMYILRGTQLNASGTNPCYVRVTNADGTFYYRTCADARLDNNFSTQGNTNPFTGQAGWVKVP